MLYCVFAAKSMRREYQVYTYKLWRCFVIGFMKQSARDNLPDDQFLSSEDDDFNRSCYGVIWKTACPSTAIHKPRFIGLVCLLLPWLEIESFNSYHLVHTYLLLFDVNMRWNIIQRHPGTHKESFCAGLLKKKTNFVFIVEILSILNCSSRRILASPLIGIMSL